MKLCIAVIAAVVLSMSLSGPVAPAFAAQTIGSGSNPGEDHTNSSGCYGDCGYGCAWWRCGHTSNCVNHDYYTRNNGMFSGAAMKRLGAALVDWGSCWYGRGKQSVSTTIRSGWTGKTDPNPRRLK